MLVFTIIAECIILSKLGIEKNPFHIRLILNLFNLNTGALKSWRCFVAILSQRAFAEDENRNKYSQKEQCRCERIKSIKYYSSSRLFCTGAAQKREPKGHRHVNSPIFSAQFRKSNYITAVCFFTPLKTRIRQ